MKQDLINFLVEYGNDAQGDDWYKVKEDDYVVENSLQKLEKLIDQHVQIKVEEALLRASEKKKHLKRDDWMSVCGSVNITTGSFVEIADDATCLKCIALTNTRKGA